MVPKITPEGPMVMLEQALALGRRPRPMLSVCPVPGCSTLTMGGGTCVAHDPPASVTFERGRPYAGDASGIAAPIAS